MNRSMCIFQRRDHLMDFLFAGVVSALLFLASCAPGNGQTIDQQDTLGQNTTNWACLRGNAVVNKERSAIDFTAKCLAGSDHKVGFLVRRFKLAGNPSAEVKITNVRVRPLVRGSKIPARYGSCKLRTGIAECTGRGTGLLRVTGRVWVAHGEACQAGVALTEVHGPRCVRGECLGSPSVHDFLRTRPQGC